jgi:hypothetical protein
MSAAGNTQHGSKACYCVILQNEAAAAVPTHPEILSILDNALTIHAANPLEHLLTLLQLACSTRQHRSQYIEEHEIIRPLEAEITLLSMVWNPGKLDPRRRACVTIIVRRMHACHALH